MAKQLAFHMDSSACIGCKVCSVSCKDKNNLPVGITWRRVYQYGGGGWASHPTRADLKVPNQLFTYSMSVACNHCEKPACTEACPTGAMSKGEGGVVSVDASKCIGCRYCEWACPYGAPQFDEKAGKMTKCNFCQELLAKGENPVCVDACVMRAISFGELDELKAKFGSANAVEPLPSPDITRPSLVLTPHRHAQASGKGTGKILNPEVM
jgi:anaerobic dimethyl sulfoxide reductase subunit B (iron-sulfur subunit)